MTGNISIVHKCGGNGQCNSKTGQISFEASSLLSRVVSIRESYAEYSEFIFNLQENYINWKGYVQTSFLQPARCS